MSALASWWDRISLLSRHDWRRKRAVERIGTQKTAVAERSLVQASCDPAPLVRAAAFSKLGEQLLSLRGRNALILGLNDSDCRARLASVQAIGKSGDDDFFRLLSPLISDHDYAIREATLDILSPRFDHSSCDFLGPCLRDPSEAVRSKAADCLLKLADGVGREVLHRYLNDTRREVRKSVVRALTMAPHPSDVSGLLHVLSDVDHDVRRSAAWALAETHDSQAAKQLAEMLLEDNDSACRVGAAHSLGAIASPESVPALSAAVLDSNESVRVHVAIALGKISSPDVIEPLTILLDDDSNHVKLEAVRSIAQAGDSTVFPRLALVSFGKPPLDPYPLPFGYTSHSMVRGAAHKGLESFQSDRFVDYFADLLSQSSVPSEVRYGAVEALGAVGSSQAKAVLRASLKDESFWVADKAATFLEDDSGLEIREFLVRSLEEVAYPTAIQAMSKIIKYDYREAAAALEPLLDFHRGIGFAVAAARTLLSWGDGEALSLFEAGFRTFALRATWVPKESLYMPAFVRDDGRPDLKRESEDLVKAAQCELCVGTASGIHHSKERCGACGWYCNHPRRSEGSPQDIAGGPSVSLVTFFSCLDCGAEWMG